MIHKTVATKLTEEEHSKLIDFCNDRGCTPSAFLKESINEMMNAEKPKEEPQRKELSLDEIREMLKIEPNVRE